jgi:hypothetical protein
MSDMQKPATQSEGSSAPMKLIRAKDLIKHVAVAERSVVRWFDQGLIPGYRIGKVVLFDLEQVMEAIKKGGVR